MSQLRSHREACVLDDEICLRFRYGALLAMHTCNEGNADEDLLRNDRASLPQNAVGASAYAHCDSGVGGRLVRGGRGHQVCRSVGSLPSDVAMKVQQLLRRKMDASGGIGAACRRDGEAFALRS